ncbi:alpha-1,2-fucosyltransferase [Aminobacter anthyllidis]|uniref:Alpha-1,2-fucosyltransferase n=1 Tax=Aminobacter anthyllidis TaxID=1035067 RepID=A0A9X1D4P6_9HYPH|nr:alpha-1,2-fucosyltransferase [Aminobacter anthyllidis]MBT1155131.1 alpha-1,2-fucosyltransferase [Aminobacter anthyllidis]
MKRQIVSKIFGGLGNQMFQFAMGRAMAIRSQSALLLDTRWFDTAPSVTFRLGHFNIGPAVTSGTLPPRRRQERLRYYLWHASGRFPRRLKENGLGFDADMVAPRTNLWLDGYWQSERYFADCIDTIRDDFRIVTPPSDENAKHLAAIAACPAISLHVRRGDYLLPENQALFAACSKQYYAKAVDLMASKMAEEPVIYVFSDDPDWARDNLSFPVEKRVMGHNGRDADYEDMRLMSACRNHIIANSSFSWWGAWLNPAPDKIVIGPASWFADSSASNPDILPDSWLKLSNQA